MRNKLDEGYFASPLRHLHVSGASYQHYKLVISPAENHYQSHFVDSQFLETHEDQLPLGYMQTQT